MGHANARFFGPENGGIIFNSNLTIGAYRQDHDQVYQQNVNLHYQRSKNGWWTDFTWRYDSGLVVGAVNSLSDALALDGRPAVDDRILLRSERASLSHRITACNSPDYGAAADQHSRSRHRERRPQSAANQVPAHIRSGRRHGQSVPCGARPHQACASRS